MLKMKKKPDDNLYFFGLTFTFVNYVISTILVPTYIPTIILLAILMINTEQYSH